MSQRLMLSDRVVMGLALGFLVVCVLAGIGLGRVVQCARGPC